MTDPTAEFEGLRAVADYQLGAGAGAGLFPDGASFDVERSRSGRPRQIIAPAGRVVTFLTDGRLSLGLEGGRRLDAALDPPEYRVVVGDESAPYVRDGRNVFAKFVRSVDPAVRPGDEVLVLHEEEGLLGVGRAVLSAAGMADFGTGMAVKVRAGESDA